MATTATPPSPPVRSFFDQVMSRSIAIDSLLCVGLDPHSTELADPTSSACVENFCLELIAATSSVAVCYKPNSAFFEALGPSGLTVLASIISVIRALDIPVLLDVKRGDISSTATAYATAAYDQLHVDAVTLAPYMGRDSITPFLESDPTKGVFLLCKTSNDSASDVQMLRVLSSSTKTRDYAPTFTNTKFLYEHVATLAQEWNTQDNIGLVVGATDVEALLRVRACVPRMWLLAPGLGAQGGSLEAAVTAGCDSSGSRILFPISRGISRADDPAAAAQTFRRRINVARRSLSLTSGTSTSTSTATIATVTTACPTTLTAPSTHHDAVTQQRQFDFIAFCLERQVLKFGSFTLKSGRISPYFFNAGMFSSGVALAKVGAWYADTIVASGLEFDLLFGPAYKGITLAAAIAMALAAHHGRDVPYVYNRKEVKDHGEGGLLVGPELAQKRVLIVDDVITAGTAIGEAIKIITNAGGVSVGVCLALDRQEKMSATSSLSAVQHVATTHNLTVLSIASLESLILYLSQQDNDLDTHRESVQTYRATFGI